MHKSGKVLMIIGGVICLGGIVGFAGAGAANPAAMNYYQGLIQQGYDAQTALMHTAQHFPGWQP